MVPKPAPVLAAAQFSRWLLSCGKRTRFNGGQVLHYGFGMCSSKLPLAYVFKNLPNDYVSHVKGGNKSFFN